MSQTTRTLARWSFGTTVVFVVLGGAWVVGTWAYRRHLVETMKRGGDSREVRQAAITSERWGWLREDAGVSLDADQRFNLHWSFTSDFDFVGYDGSWQRALATVDSVILEHDVDRGLRQSLLTFLLYDLRVLRDSRDGNPWPALLPQFARIAEQETDPDIRRLAALFHADVGANLGIPPFAVAWLRSEDVEKRALAVHVVAIAEPDRTDVTLPAIRGLPWFRGESTWLDPNDRSREDVEAALDTLGRRAAALEPDLLAVLDENDPDRRLLALGFLRRIEASSPATVEALRRVVREYPRQEVDTAVWLLGLIGPPAAAAVPDLVARFAKERDVHTAVALFRVDPEAARVAGVDLTKPEDLEWPGE